MLAVCAVTIMGLMAGSHSASTACNNTVHPPVLDHFAGRWTLVAGSLSHSPAMEALKLRDSITIYISNSSNPSTAAYTQINRFQDECQYLYYNISAVGSDFTFDVENRFNLTGTFFHMSCSDCIVMKWVVESKKRNSFELYLLSRRKQVEVEVMEEFKAQLECNNLPAPVVMDSTKEVCPEEPVRPTAAVQPQVTTN
uniref:Apolipoprotein M n=1 Tax=Gouania willdenowi TaxID=441366 RepID=A0A8C5EL50_GOUWI